MVEIDERFIKRLVAYLRKLPSVATRSDRHESWMTAEQIRAWSQAEITAEEIDEVLLKWWEKGRKKGTIRPAKYPSLMTGLRLWGHVKNVGPPPKNLDPRRKGTPITLEATRVPRDAPQAFVSYSFHDLHLAARIRLLLGERYGLRTWLADEMVLQERIIFEGVRAALESSEWIMILVTRHALGSAWVHTEVNTALGLVLGSGRPKRAVERRAVVFVLDANDNDLMQLLLAWNRDPDQQFEPALIDPLLVGYAQMERDGHRCARYRYNATKILGLMRPPDRQLALYPRRPAPWTGNGRFRDFEDVIRDLRGVGGA